MPDFLRLQYGVSVKAAQSGDSRSFDVIASTDDVDMEGDVLVQDWDLARFIKNPIVLYYHNILASPWGGGEPEDSLPIGFASSVGVEGGKLRATITFVDEKASELAERCYQGFLQKSLRAVSVGFASKRGRMESIDGRDVFVLSGNELLEISVCPIPCNPNAVAETRAKSLDVLRGLVKSNHSPASPAQQAESDMKLLAKSLGLKEDASEAEILSAITMLSSEAKSVPAKLLEATGTKSVDEALGVIKAGQSAIVELAKSTALLAVEKAAGEKRDREALVTKGVADKKLTPALKDWALATEKASDGTESYKVPFATLKSYLENAPTIGVLAGAGGVKVDGEAVLTEGGEKGWEDLGPAEKHNIFVASKSQYDALKADWERRGKPAKAKR